MEKYEKQLFKLFFKGLVEYTQPTCSNHTEWSQEYWIIKEDDRLKGKGSRNPGIIVTVFIAKLLI